MTRDRDIQATTRALYDVIALQEELADALAELGPPLREPDVMVEGARCAECGKAADSWRFMSDPFRDFSFPVRMTAAEARIWSQPHPAASHCPGAISLLALEPVPDDAA